MMAFNYYKGIFPHYEFGQCCVWLAPIIRSRTELHKKLYCLLGFPGYYGFNWNALYDCLCDFHWITDKKIVLIHEQLPELPVHDLDIYLDILNDAILSWVDDDKHELEVCFSLSDKEKIENITIATK
jgi:hypothetical protein